MQPHQPLIFIGDIHGQYQTLITLLEKLGFTETRYGWRHPRARAIFLGDLIDRGPDSRAVVETVRPMVEHGYAECLMGNHELNAIHYHTPDGQGGYLRTHSDRNHRQHKETLASFDSDITALNDAITWFKTLPVAIDHGQVRAVHATWSYRHLEPFTVRHNGFYFIDQTQVERAAQQGTDERAAVDILLKGAELRLPNDACFLDKSGEHWRYEARLNWWQQDHPRWEDAITVPGKPRGLDMQDRPVIPDEFRDLLYPSDAPPVFFGHYWMHGHVRLQAHNAFCADYSAGKGDRLAAYYWHGEPRLSTDRIVTVEVRDT